ncbi:alpha/beta hydrolase [Streptomyces sp. MST-110588]|uniref:alpha/beta hydrolase n=1 Tax=Streptomyces sp. MST-110588 TaxID=2833628 RepID=UPI001F5C5D8D|nr:alpha/beta hydrolase [Streptomyces sp. MST-110588]UNO43503.1 alpha/beta hydrolase [Streptomyces sp. MST-110588]
MSVTTTSVTATRPTFLLVPGAWHRPTCWAALQEALTADGRHSRTVALRSAGPQSTPTAGMYDDAEEIAAHLRRIEGPVVVVAHSYGGLPATQAVTGDSNVTHLVYLAAYMPMEGESLGAVHGQDGPAPGDEDVERTCPAVFDDPRTALYADLPEDRATHALGQLVEQSLRSFQQRVTRAAWRTVPSTYVLCERDQALPPALQEKMAARATHVERLATGHSPFLAAPAELATLLGKIASSASRAATAS